MEKKLLLQRILNVFESGTSEGKYDILVIYDDGVNDSFQNILPIAILYADKTDKIINRTP